MAAVEAAVPTVLPNSEALFFFIFGEKKWWILPSGYVKIAIENGDL